MNAKREEAIQRITARTGKTREQAEAFLDLLCSAFRRRGWIDGNPLSDEQMRERFDTFLDYVRQLILDSGLDSARAFAESIDVSESEGGGDDHVCLLESSTHRPQNSGLR